MFHRLQCLLLAISLLIMSPLAARADFISLPGGVKVERDIAYIPNGDPAQKLDIYLPEKPGDKPLPLVVYVHGGGWMGGTKNNPYGHEFLLAGYAMASIEYRFSQVAKFPAQIQDCQAALRWIRANAKKYNIDAEHVGIFGESAGGHLVTLMGLTGDKHSFEPIGENRDQSDRVQAVCDLFGPSDFNTVIAQAAADKTPNVIPFNTKDDPCFQLLGATIGSDKLKADAASPVHYVTKNAPPFLILHGTADALVPYAQSVELRDVLAEASVDVTLQSFPGCGHGGKPFVQPSTIAFIQRFFDKHLKGLDVKLEPLTEAQTKP